MVSLIAGQLQLQDGSCLLTSGSQTSVPAALVSSGPQSTASLTAGTKSTTASLTAVSTTLKTGAGAGAAHGAGTIAGAILGILVIGLVAYGVNKAVRVYIE